VPSDRVLRDSVLSDLETELQKLAMDALRAPERVIEAHLTNQRSHIRIDLRTPTSIPGFPSPVAAKTRSVPAHERLRANNMKGRLIKSAHNHS
jgi:hypothetical protein